MNYWMQSTCLKEASRKFLLGSLDSTSCFLQHVEVSPILIWWQWVMWSQEDIIYKNVTLNWLVIAPSWIFFLRRSVCYMLLRGVRLALKFFLRTKEAHGIWRTWTKLDLLAHNLVLWCNQTMNIHCWMLPICSLQIPKN